MKEDNTLYLVIIVVILTTLMVIFSNDKDIKNQVIDLSKVTITVFFAYKRGE